MDKEIKLHQAEPWESDKTQKAWFKLYGEIFDSLSCEDSNALAEYCKEKGLAWCYGWYLHNLPEVAEFIRANPEKRKNRQDWANNRPRYRLLVLASLWHLMAANAWRCIKKTKVHDGQSADDFIQKGGAYMDAFEKHITFWPYHNNDLFSVGEDNNLANAIIANSSQRGRGETHDDFLHTP